MLPRYLIQGRAAGPNRAPRIQRPWLSGSVHRVTRLPNRAAALFVVGAALAWSMLGIWGKMAQAQQVGPVEIGFWRALIAGALFGLHALITRASFPKGRDAVAIGAFGLIGVSLFYSSNQWAVKLGGASLASVLLYTAPAFVAVLSWIVLKQRLSRLESISVSASIVGVALISLGGGAGVQVSLASVGVGLLAGFLYALYYLFGQHYFRRYEPSAVFAIMMPVGALGLLPFSAHHPTTPSAWAPVLGLAVVCTYLAYLLHSTGLKNLPATRASVIASVEPVSAAILAAWLFGERLSVLALVGAGVVVGAAATLGVARSAPADDSAAAPA